MRLSLITIDTGHSVLLFFFLEWHLLVAHPHFCYSRIPQNRNNYYQVSRQRPGLTTVPLESLNLVESNGTTLVITSILVPEKNLLLKII